MIGVISVILENLKKVTLKLYILTKLNLKKRTALNFKVAFTLSNILSNQYLDIWIIYLNFYFTKIIMTDITQFFK